MVRRRGSCDGRLGVWFVSVCSCWERWSKWKRGGWGLRAERFTRLRSHTFLFHLGTLGMYRKSKSAWSRKSQHEWFHPPGLTLEKWFDRVLRWTDWLSKRCGGFLGGVPPSLGRTSLNKINNLQINWAKDALAYPSLTFSGLVFSGLLWRQREVLQAV